MSITVKDPLRLVSDPACPESQRALLQLGADIAPPADAQTRVWLALAGAIGVPAAAGAADAAAKAAAGTATKAQTGLTGGVKIAVIVTALAALAALVAVGSRLLSGSQPTQPTIAVAPAPAPGAPAVPPVPPPPATDTPPPADADPARPLPAARRTVRDALRPRATASAPPAAPSPAARLREETTLIRDARQALRAGDAARALRVLDECRRLFPAGVLVQERERLVIEALMKDGRAAEAATRAAAFLRQYPDSPHTAEIRALGPGTSGTSGGSR